MRRTYLFALWAVLFILCAACGFIPEPEGWLRTVVAILSYVFFLPPALLLADAEKKKDRETAMLVRNLAALSLGLSAAVLILNFLTAFRSEFWGLTLHYVLTIVSTPMVCNGRWAMSLFLWACLLVAALQQLRGSER